MAEKTTDTINRTAREFFSKGIAALERNNLDYAIEMLCQCLASEPNFCKGRQFLRAAQMKRAGVTGSLKRVMTAAKTAPLLTKAKMTVQKNPVEAMSMAEQILSSDPTNGQALMLLAEAAETAGYVETTMQTLEQLVKISPRNARALHWLARCRSSRGEHDAARDIYEQLLQINPNDFEAQNGLKASTARGAMQSAGWEDARSYRDVMKDKGEAVALEQESRVVRAEDMIENLIKESLAKLQRDPDHVVIQRELGKLYGQKGDYDTALVYLEKIFAAEAGADPTLEKEIADIKSKRIESTITQKKQQLAANPANAIELQNEIAALEKELIRHSLQETERLVARYPNDLMYRYDLGVLYMKMGDVQRAIEQFQKSVGLPQRRLASLNYLGQCFYAEGLQDLAVDQYRKAIEEMPSMDALKKDVIYNLGLAYEALGKHDEAVAEYKKIAAVDFGFRDVRSKISSKPAQSKS
jgi:tetratricopeptide (TPR) repeat protein